MEDMKPVNILKDEEKLRQDFIYEMRETTLDYYVNHFAKDAQIFYQVNHSVSINYKPK